jgi:EAL domain-containing protein (putative c-di-GMP-specific phosphodiesterase class I)/ActR/RegA family two-component response regulator
MHVAPFSSASPTVIVVDDDDLMCDLAAHVIEAAGVSRVHTLTDPKRALALLDAGHQIDLLFCDLDMPEMDGVELLRHLAARSFQGGIVVLSGADASILSTAEQLAAAHHLRVFGAVSKPPALEKVVAILERWTTETTAGSSGTNANMISELDLRRAIQDDDLVLHYQPRINLVTGEVTGVEALVRWQHSLLGLVYPGDFIPMAEETGLIVPLTKVVLRKALNQAGRWLAAGLDLKVGVNVPVDSLAEVDFCDQVVAAAADAALPSSSVIVEVTESKLLDRLDRTLDTLVRMRLKGIGLAIDDFGTGFSSMAQLRQIPFTDLKVDRQFVDGAARDPRLRAFLETSLDLALRLGLSAVAEGVENLDDWELLRALNCHEAQGYFAAKPMPASALPEWIGNWRGRHAALSAAMPSTFTTGRSVGPV